MRLSFMKTFGGKGRLIKWILSNFPKGYENMTYIDAAVGGGSILLNKRPSVCEIANDIDVATYAAFVCAKTGVIESFLPQYSEPSFIDYRDYPNLSNPLRIGINEYVLRNMSRSGMKKDFAWSNRLRGGKPGDMNAYLNKVKQLPLISMRLQNVYLFNQDMLNCLRMVNLSSNFTYIDPPYVKSTRISKSVYSHEMTDQQHVELVDFLNNEWKGKYLISNYANAIYDNLKGNCITKNVTNSASQRKKQSRRIECLWRNY